MRENHGYGSGRWLADLDAIPDGDTVNRSLGTWCHCPPDTTKPKGDRDRQDLRVQYYVLPDDPLAALNILREAAGLEPLSDEDDPAAGE